MAYDKQTWANGAAGATPLSAARLNHIEDGIDAVDTALEAKQDAGDYATNAALTSGLAGKANSSHTHTIANVTGLQAALDGKQASGSYATTTQLTSGLAAKQDAGDYATNDDLEAGLATKVGQVLVTSFDDITEPGPLGTVYVRVV